MHIILDNHQLQEAITELSKSDFIAVDTEFIRETTFWPELCLIQMATPDFSCLIDPLSKDLTLDLFFELMQNELITKVFHAARQDLEIIYHLGGIIPHPLFDTQIAAMVCGFGESVAYDQLVFKLTNIKLDKTSQFTNWRHRPLSEMQKLYALADVTHLATIYPMLQKKLKTTHRTDWINEEMATISCEETYDLKPENAWKRLKKRVKKPIELLILQKIANWREHEARARNVPRSRIIKDDTIYEIAQQQPKNQEDFAKLRTVAKGWERSNLSQELIAIIHTAQHISKDELPELEPTSNYSEGGAAIEILRILLKTITENEGVAPKIIATSSDLEQIALKGEEADVPALSGWRRELFGKFALEMLQGKVALKFENRHVVIVPISETTDQ
jgi:ribonuclease D